MSDCGRNAVTALLATCAATMLLASQLNECVAQEHDNSQALLAGVTESTESKLQTKIASLIEQLGDPNYHQRVNAKWELERIGLAAFEQLQEAAQAHPNAHIARAARYLIESQNVVWWLETDSLDVRELLKDYNASKDDSQETTLQQLAELGSPDALLALSRMVRFESSELRSKSAALYLMETILKRMSIGDGETQVWVDATLVPSLRLTLGDSQRTAAKWLYTFMQHLELDASKSTATKSSLESWRLFVGAEHAIVVVPAKNVADEFARRAANEVTSRLYRFLGSWVTKHYSREDALDVVRPSLKLVGEDSGRLLTAAIWALDSELPELVVELAEEYSEEFSIEAQLGYLLAESHLRLGDDRAADAAADAASASIATQLEKLKNLPNLNFGDIQAGRHEQLALILVQRGLYRWAEKEFLTAITFESKREAAILGKLAEFYWSGAEHEKAAATLKPLADEAAENPEIELPNAPNVFDSPALDLANYYLYSGLAAIDRNDKVSASEFLRKAMELEAVLPNPDVVIAMQAIADEEPFRSYFEKGFAKMAGDFRVRVLEAEQLLSRSTDRASRAAVVPVLAAECNQLAWLLSKCGTSPQEALALSRRSLELTPDKPTYLDTLARCYFAAGQIENAVRTQKQALKLAPHERQLAAQLKEFEAALGESNGKSKAQ